MKPAGRTFTRNWRVDAAGIFACAVLTFAVYLAGAEPLMQRRDQAADCAEQLAQQRLRQQQLMTSNRELKARLATVEQTLLKAQITLQPARLVNQRIAALTTLANDTGLEVQSINSGALVVGPRFSQLPIQLSSTGGYRTAATFLHRAQQTFKDMSVTAFELSDNPADAKAATFSLQFVWYVLPESR